MEGLKISKERLRKTPIPYCFLSETRAHDSFCALKKKISTEETKKNRVSFGFNGCCGFYREITSGLKENILLSRDFSVPPLCDSRTRLRLIFGIVSYSVGGVACLFVRSSSKSSEGNVGLWMIGVWGGRERQRYGWERYSQLMSRISQKASF